MRRSKIVSIVITVVLMFALSLCVYAAEEAMKITVEEKIVCDREEEVVVTVSLANNPGFTYLKLDITYDEEAFTLDRVENGTLVENISQGAYFIWSADENCISDGVLAEFVFKTNVDAEYAEYSIEVNCIECSDYDEEDVEVVCSDANVIIRYYLGDVDNDGYLTIRDAAAILQYKAGWGNTIVERNADVDKNGSISIRDAARILQFKAGWFDSID